MLVNHNALWLHYCFTGSGDTQRTVNISATLWTQYCGFVSKRLPDN